MASGKHVWQRSFQCKIGSIGDVAARDLLVVVHLGESEWRMQRMLHGMRCFGGLSMAWMHALKWWKFLQTNGHDQPGLSAFRRDNDVTDRCGSYPGSGQPDHLWVVRPGMVDVIGQGKDLLKRCHHVCNVCVIAGFICIPAHCWWQVCLEHVVCMVDGIALCIVHGCFLSFFDVLCCVQTSYSGQMLCGPSLRQRSLQSFPH